MESALAVGLVAGLCLAALRLGRTPWLRRRATLLAPLALLVAVGHSVFLSDRLVWAAWVPWSGVVFLVLATPLPLVLLFLTLLWPRLTGSVPQRLRLAAPLLALTLWLSLGSFWGTPPETSAAPPLADGVVRQTSEVSCSAASAATLLQVAQLPATETELAALCLTRRAGTPLLGVYRGLRHKAAGTPWRVGVLSHAPLAQLRAATQTGPVLISVGLDRWQRGYDPRYVTEWGWTPGKRHAVVVFGFLPGGKLDIGDPSVGRETWSVESLAVLWNGEGIQLLPR
ncbi:hypothetical protein [Armatimonas rosea]|uniref:Peptidase C39-like domain-containing protein n=1 Tax=Armatimonas rosea TaxID=685828 RepID=A0A7W9SU28_ARMRO|nr:hypothetical protein [Armatimonas rosea]MBB6052420.1 hypothetical protein [Armatimonas rosea]